MSVAAVIFDFDGVLANSEPLHLAGFQAALVERGLALPADDYYAHFLGYNDPDAFAAMRDHYHWLLTAPDVTDLVAVKGRHMVRLLAAPDVLYPGAAECVRRVAGHVPVAIASGAMRNEIEQVLRANDLSNH